MYTGRPQFLIDNTSETKYLWLLQWGREHMAPEQHMTFSDLSSGEKVLNMALFYLLEDLQRGAERLFSEANQTAALARSIEGAHASVREYRFTKRR